MGDELGRRQRAWRAKAIQAAAQQQRFAVRPVELEPLRMPPLDRPRQPFGRRHLPDDFGRAHAFADSVEHVEQLAFQQITIQPVAHELRVLLVDVILAGRLHLDRQLRHGALAGAQHRKIVKVFLLHFLGQLEIGDGVAFLGRTQNVAQLGRIEPARRVARLDRADRRARGRRNLLR